MHNKKQVNSSRHINFLNVCASKNKASKYVTKMDSTEKINRQFHNYKRSYTLFLIIDKVSRQKINMAIRKPKQYN